MEEIIDTNTFKDNTQSLLKKAAQYTKSPHVVRRNLILMIAFPLVVFLAFYNK